MVPVKAKTCDVACCARATEPVATTPARVNNDAVPRRMRENRAMVRIDMEHSLDGSFGGHGLQIIPRRTEPTFPFWPSRSARLYTKGLRVRSTEVFQTVMSRDRVLVLIHIMTSQCPGDTLVSSRQDHRV